MWGAGSSGGDVFSNQHTNVRFHSHFSCLSLVRLSFLSFLHMLLNITSQTCWLAGSFPWKNQFFILKCVGRRAACREDGVRRAFTRALGDQQHQCYPHCLYGRKSEMTGEESRCEQRWSQRLLPLGVLWFPVGSGNKRCPHFWLIIYSERTEIIRTLILKTVDKRLNNMLKHTQQIWQLLTLPPKPSSNTILLHDDLVPLVLCNFLCGVFKCSSRFCYIFPQCLQFP